MNERSRKAIEKIIIHAERILNYSNIPSWEDEALRVDAIVFNLAQIGELVRLIDPQIQTSTQIPWGAMRGFRNRIIHDYDSINMQIVIATINNDIAPLIAQLQELIQTD